MRGGEFSLDMESEAVGFFIARAWSARGGVFPGHGVRSRDVGLMGHGAPGYMDRELWWMDALNDSLVLSLWGRVTIFGQYRGMLFIESTSREDLAPVVSAVFDCTRLVASAGPSGVGRRHLR